MTAVQPTPVHPPPNLGCHATIPEGVYTAQFVRETSGSCDPHLPPAQYRILTDVTILPGCSVISSTDHGCEHMATWKCSDYTFSADLTEQLDGTLAGTESFSSETCAGTYDVVWSK